MHATGVKVYKNIGANKLFFRVHFGPEMISVISRIGQNDNDFLLKLVFIVFSNCQNGDCKITND